jgi:thiol-disulfide isomerase/thioredoxin
MKENSHRPLGLAGLGFLALLALAGCAKALASAEATGSDSPVRGTATPAADQKSPQEILALPADFDLVLYQGEEELGARELSLSEALHIGKPVVLNMFAGLCPPCRIEMPDLQEVYNEHKDRITLVGVDVGPFTALGSAEDGLDLLEELKVSFPAGTTLDASVVRSYRVIGMPSTFFIKTNGEVMKKWTGLLTKEKMNELVEPLLSE